MTKLTVILRNFTNALKNERYITRGDRATLHRQTPILLKKTTHSFIKVTDMSAICAYRRNEKYRQILTQKAQEKRARGMPRY
jgi:hypothetical protein